MFASEKVLGFGGGGSIRDPEFPVFLRTGGRGREMGVGASPAPEFSFGGLGGGGKCGFRIDMRFAAVGCLGGVAPLAAGIIADDGNDKGGRS